MFIEKVKKAREDQNLTQIDLAEKSGVSLPSIRLFEQGARVSNRIKARIAYALGLDISDVETNRAKWADEVDPQTSPWVPEKKSEAEEKFNAELAKIFEQLEGKVDIYDKEIFFNMDYQIGFQEILWLTRKYEVKT